MCVRVSSSLIFSHANEGVGAKITRPIFPPPQWGHYLLMFCIFPPPSHSHAFFLLSLLLGSSHCHPVTMSVYFQQLLKHNVFAITEDESVKPSVLCKWENRNGGRSQCNELEINRISMKFLNIARHMQEAFASNHKYSPNTYNTTQSLLVFNAVFNAVP